MDRRRTRGGLGVPDRARRAVQEDGGQGAARVLTAWRIELAAKRFRQPRDSVASIADSVGYGSDSALSTAFKRVMGTSPREFREHGPRSARATNLSRPLSSRQDVLDGYGRGRRLSAR
ncbi:helix-turn-helix domain-containing protein [Streptomyces sp. NPDC052107]|uniref:helix-turn-helix domain-containing protein n=1 Tax=Streptomyces sp. NPDC052107 TaxID=3155632 RepID=UPI00341426C1